MDYVLLRQSDLLPNLLAEIFAMSQDANLLIKQSQGITQKFVNEWNSRKENKSNELTSSN